MQNHLLLDSNHDLDIPLQSVLYPADERRQLSHAVRQTPPTDVLTDKDAALSVADIVPFMDEYARPTENP